MPLRRGSLFRSAVRRRTCPTHPKDGRREDGHKEKGQNVSPTSSSTPPVRLALSMREAAQVAGLGFTTIRRVVQEGQLPTVRVGRRRLVRVSDLEAWLAEHAR